MLSNSFGIEGIYAIQNDCKQFENCSGINSTVLMINLMIPYTIKETDSFIAVGYIGGGIINFSAESEDIYSQSLTAKTVGWNIFTGGDSYPKNGNLGWGICFGYENVLEAEFKVAPIATQSLGLTKFLLQGYIAFRF